MTGVHFGEYIRGEYCDAAFDNSEVGFGTAQVCGQQYVLENQATEDKLALLVL